jgi:hypothetical protein
MLECMARQLPVTDYLISWRTVDAHKIAPRCAQRCLVLCGEVLPESGTQSAGSGHGTLCNVKEMRNVTARASIVTVTGNNGRRAYHAQPKKP